MTRLIHLFIALLLTVTSFADEAPKPSKTMLITGGCGFIGSNFLNYMFDHYPEYQFIVLDALTYAGSLDNIPAYIFESDRFRFEHGSITDASLVDQLMSQSDYVVHFAAESHVSRSIKEDYVFFDTDLLGTRVLLKALVENRDKVERFIHISSSEVYGTAEYEPMDEKHPLNARSPYAAAKLAAERLVYAYNCTYDTPAVIIRPFNNYGPRQHLEKIIPRFIASSLRQRPLTIHGNGLQSRDWVHVHDVCIALDKVIHFQDFSKIKHEILNIGTGKCTTIADIAQIILKELDLPADHYTLVPDRPGQVECHIGDFKKAQDLLGWSPSIPIEIGLQQTIEWYIDNPAFCKKLERDAVVHLNVNGAELEL